MENSIITKREIEQGIKVALKILTNYNKYHSNKNYIDFLNSIPYQYTEDECKEIIDLFLVVNLEEGNSIVLVDKNDSEDVVVFNDDVKWKWNDEDGLEIHIWNGECSININIENIIEMDDDKLDIIGSQWMLDVM